MGETKSGRSGRKWEQQIVGGVTGDVVNNSGKSDSRWENQIPGGVTGHG
jgi:hypothetical protein